MGTTELLDLGSTTDIFPAGEKSITVKLRTLAVLPTLIGCLCVYLCVFSFVSVSLSVRQCVSVHVFVCVFCCLCVYDCVLCVCL